MSNILKYSFITLTAYSDTSLRKVSILFYNCIGTFNGRLILQGTAQVSHSSNGSHYYIGSATFRQ